VVAFTEQLGLAGGRDLHPENGKQWVDLQMLAAMLWDLLRMKAREYPEGRSILPFSRLLRPARLLPASQ
jgi:hypothetical protein